MKNILILTPILFLILIPGYSFAQETTAEDYLRIGVRLSENPDTYDEAFTNLHNAVRSLPEGDSRLRIAYTKLAKIYNYWGRYDDAVKYCNYVFNLDPDYVEAKKHLGIANFHMNKYDEAIDNLLKWLADQPMDTEAIEYLGLCYMNLREYKNAMDQFAKIDTDRARINFYRVQQSYLAEHVEPIYNEGVTYFNRGDWENAILKFQECLVRAPYYRDAKEMLEQTKLNWKTELEEKLMEHPLDTNLRSALKVIIGARRGAIDFYYDGLFSFKQKDWAKAYRYLNKAMEIDPSIGDVRERRNAAINNRIAELKNVLQKEKMGDRNLMFELQTVLSEAGKDARFVVPYYDGLMYYRSKNWKDAVLGFEKVPESFDGIDEVQDMLNIAITHWVRNLEDSLSKDPSNQDLIIELLTAMSKAGQDTTFIIPYYTGLDFYHRGNWKNAIVHFEKVPQSSKVYSDVQYKLSNSFEKLIVATMGSLDNAPDNVEYRRTLRQILAKIGENKSIKVIDIYYDGLNYLRQERWLLAANEFRKIKDIKNKRFSPAELESFALQQAIGTNLKRIEVNPENNRARIDLVKAFIMFNDFDSAALYFEQALRVNRAYITYDELFPENLNDNILFKLGLLYYKIQSYRLSISRLKEISPQYPNFLEAKFYLALAYSKVNEFFSAQAKFTEILSAIGEVKGMRFVDSMLKREGSDDPDILFNFGKVVKDLLSNDDAKEYFFRAFAIRGQGENIIKEITPYLTNGDKIIIKRLDRINKKFEKAKDEKNIALMESLYSEFYKLAQDIKDIKLRSFMMNCVKMEEGREWIRRFREEKQVKELYEEAEKLRKQKKYIQSIVSYQQILSVIPGDKKAVNGIIEAKRMIQLKESEVRERVILFSLFSVIFGLIVSFVISKLFKK